MPADPGTIVQVLSNTQIEGLPGPVSVHLFRPDRELATVDENADVHAVITYSNGATQNTFQCDWEGQLTLVCSKISIALETYKPFHSGAYAPGTRQHIFGALIGIGATSSGGSESIGYTAPSILLESASEVFVAIPDFARRYYPIIMSQLTDEQLPRYYMEMYNAQGYGVTAVPLSREMMLHGVPIPGSAARVIVGTNALYGAGIFHHFRLGL
jgi:hypothetical protein